MGWKVNLWARAHNPANARMLLHNALCSCHTDATDYGGSGAGIYNNLFDAHPPYQIDGNFGVCAGIAEMLMQSHAGYIHLLPALPEDWKNGYIHGLKALGNFTVSIEWSDGKLDNASIHSVCGGTCKLFQNNMEARQWRVVRSDGRRVRTRTDKNGALSFRSKKGQDYQLIKR